ncbi:hypothetical protein PInf_027093 [Phytophthora infestans]|nr:hypothetical protein PInf_027093 [Phytophthora infestans]
MVKYGRKRARIYEYLLDKGESLVKKDVDNIVQRVKAEFRGGLDDDDTCAQALTEFAAMDGNVATVDETDAMKDQCEQDCVQQTLLLIESTVTGRNAKGMNESLKKKAQELVGGADFLMIPVNVGNSHWCGIAVDVKRTRVLYYDSINHGTYKTVLDPLYWDLAKTLSDDYEVVFINAPIQTDGHNCGFFVMLRLWRMVDNSIALDI